MGRSPEKSHQGRIITQQDFGGSFEGINVINPADIPRGEPFEYALLHRNLIGHSHVAHEAGRWHGSMRLTIGQKEISVALITIGEGEHAGPGFKIGDISMPVETFWNKFAEIEYSLKGSPDIILPELESRQETALLHPDQGLGGMSASYDDHAKKEQLDRLTDVFERSRRLLLERAKKIGIMTASSSRLTLYASGISRAVMEEEIFDPLAEDPSFTISKNYRTGKNEQATHFVVRDSFARIQPFLRGAVTSWDELSAHSQQRAYLKHLDNLTYKPGQEFYYLWKSSKHDRDPGSCYISLKTPKKRP